MWPADQYQLLDFGRGRKLERFGNVILDRPSPAAENSSPRTSELWEQATYRLDEAAESRGALPEYRWTIQYESLRFQLRVTPFGHVGLFPEHEKHWGWLRETDALSDAPQPKSMLNLFAYTGSATLAMAAVGWQVAHVDASAPSVAWARSNAHNSSLDGAPVRWLVEDASLFATRELRRGRQYDAIVLDPPSYGHGPKGQAWSIERDLSTLLRTCCQLLRPQGSLLLTGHSPHLPSACQELANWLDEAGHGGCSITSGRTCLYDLAGRPLDFGWFVRAR